MGPEGTGRTFLMNDLFFFQAGSKCGANGRLRRVTWTRKRSLRVADLFRFLNHLHVIKAKFICHKLESGINIGGVNGYLFMVTYFKSFESIRLKPEFCRKLQVETL